MTHEVINKYQRNFVFKENQGQSLNNTEQMVFMNLYLFLIEIECTIVYSILKSWENTSFYNSNISHEVINKYEVTFIFKGKSRKVTE